VTPGSVLVVGAGAIGGVVAAGLAGRGARVAVLDANREHVERMRRAGLVVDDLGQRRRVVLDAVADPAELAGPFDFGLSIVKAPALAAALTPLVERDLVETYVSLGNGLVQEQVAAIVGADRLVVGTVEWGATNLGPGRVARTTDAPFVVGEPDGAIRERTRRLADLLGAVAPVRVTSRIAAQVWTKLLVNSTFSGLGAVSGLLYREVVAREDGLELALALWREGYEVALAEGLEPEPFVGVEPARLLVDDPADPDGGQRARSAVAEIMAHVGATKASMLQDLERGARTEVDVINGGVVAVAARHGLPAPLNAAVLDRVRAIERGEARPEPGALAELRGVVAG
jgi:2-dehydropantoate 2-reductase